MPARASRRCWSASDRTPDNRTTALLAGSVTALQTLGVWELCAAQAAPLKIMRIVDDTGRLLRAPEVRFAADEIGLEAFGYNIENRHLVAALEARAGALAACASSTTKCAASSPHAAQVTLTLASGATLKAPLVVAADGRKSLCRAAAGIEIDERELSADRAHPQSRAIRGRITIPRPNSTPTSGPFTLVPLPGQRSSLVCVVDPARGRSHHGAR